MSINDPRWGNNSQSDDKQGEGKRGDEQGPPDLEDIWRDFNNKLSGMFGKRSGGGGSNTPPPAPLNPRQLGGGVVLVVLAAAALWLGSGFYTVDASQRGVVLRFGKLQEITNEGLRWHLPYPVEAVELVNVTRVRTVEVGFRANDRSKNLHESLMITDDENIVNIQFAVQYTLSDPAEFLFANKDADVTVKLVAEAAMREIVGKSKMDFVLYEGREAVAKQVHLMMQKALDEYRFGPYKGSGVLISKVTMQNAQPPEQVQEAFNDAVKAGQDRERLKSEGQAYFNDVVPKAEGTAARLREESKGYAQRVVAQADGDASRFKQIFAEYSKAPEVTRNRMYIDAMQQVYSNTTKVLVDSKGNGNLLYLPLDKLIQNGGAAPAAAVDAAVPASKPVVETPAAVPRQEPDPRSREALRSRERESR
ncbi:MULTISPECIES: FtsH protease activity modulator HflK [unclassified Uliginosibacterium]|uniref:FtsH protease activity modulator HflK n=1 Tax=unclassified Uliginosibacterium TaxID=2621521 RepID=UPI000C7B38DF|nr:MULTISPECIES: FtsH protease activity modulator HflK [unclassified Uliginosibacterium]MDO6387949.1 FtsH protease activity modulator HflK [Uliginosibacterium sp. 31-12]PLK50079.1 FtsH protease activity modulator HflK [Uliginosibacterium sp. TH139]